MMIRAVQRLKFLIVINLTIKKLISVNRTFNLTQKFVCLCVWLLMQVCECVRRGDDEVSDEEAGHSQLPVGPCNVM